MSCPYQHDCNKDGVCYKNDPFLRQCRKKNCLIEFSSVLYTLCEKHRGDNSD